MILPPRIDQNVMGSSNIQSKVKSSSPENISGNLDNFSGTSTKTPLKDTIGILKDEPVVEEKKQIKRNPPNSLASEQSTQGTGTRTKRVVNQRLHVLRTILSVEYWKQWWFLEIGDKFDLFVTNISISGHQDLFCLIYWRALDSNFNITKTKRSFI